VTHPASKVELVQCLHRLGLNQSEIARSTGINRTSVREWIRDGRSAENVRGAAGDVLDSWHAASCDTRKNAPSEHYAYLLGLYLGDGCISLMKKGVYLLRITCCDDYPHLMDLCEEAIKAVVPDNRVYRARKIGCTDVSCYSKHWLCLFPQHGPGHKHERLIRLESWQQDIVDDHPRSFVRGLIHSDGSRYLNTVSPRGKRYSYPSYDFTNASDDILGLFCAACDALGVRWRRQKRHIAITQRPSVALLDSFIGPKT
jgi:hypothetical protein